MEQIPKYIRVWLAYRWVPKDNIDSKTWFYFKLNEINRVYTGIDHAYRFLPSLLTVVTSIKQEILTERQYLEHYLEKNIVICL